MIMTNKLLPVALIAALIGGSVGALVMHSRNTSSNQTVAQDTARPVDAQYAGLRTTEAQRDSYVPAEFDTTAGQTAYKSGFADGFRAAEAGVVGERADATSYAAPAPRVVYRNTSRASNRTARASSRQVYYDYQEPRKRSFWQKRSEEHTSELQSPCNLVCRLLLEKKKRSLSNHYTIRQHRY